MILQSRKFDNSQTFIESILATITVIILQDSSSLDWYKIYKVIEEYQRALELFGSLSQTRYSKELLVSEISNSLLSADEPLVYVETALLLLGYSEIRSTAIEIAQKIVDGDMEESDNFAGYLVSLGFPHSYNLSQLNQNFANEIVEALMQLD